MYLGGHRSLDTPHNWLENTWPSLEGSGGHGTCVLMVTHTPLQSSRSRLVILHLDHSWGQLGSILGHQVAPQNYGGSTIALYHVLGGQNCSC